MPFKKLLNLVFNRYLRGIQSWSLFLILYLTCGQWHPCWSPGPFGPSDILQGVDLSSQISLQPQQMLTVLKLISTICAESAFRCGGFWPLLQSPLPLVSHQNSTSIGFCLNFKAKIICSLLAETHSLSSLCLLFPGMFSLPEMKTWVQPVPILLQISVTMSPTMQPLQVLYLPTTYSSHPCAYSYVPLFTAALLLTISVRNIATSPLSL